MRRLMVWGVLALAALALSGCARVASPRDQATVAVRVEKVRAHLLAAAGNATVGRWDLAAVHAAHPAEDLQPIDAALSAIDPQADAALRARLTAVRDAAAAHDVTIGTAIASADRALASAAMTIAGDRANTPAFDAAVASELLELATTEYSDGVANARLQEETEYQDAYAFLARAHALVPDLDPLLLAALPSLAPPAALVAADRVEALVDDEKDVLATVAGPAYAQETNTDLSPLLSHLDTAGAAATSADASAATEALAAFRGSWTQVESLVKGRSTDTYARVENDLATASAALTARGPDYAAARAAIADMRAQLVPLVAAKASYGAFDAALILLREGVEALLVVAALLAFLTKTGQPEKRGWIWGGGAAGILASVLIALVITATFSATETAGTDRELLEGVTGLFAAAMLVYMSWWLHSKSNLAGWQRYIRERSGAALARNSLLGLSLVAFLAVFREGAETALFYVGIAPSIALGDLALGLGVGAAGLVAIGLAVLVFGVRIPIRPFFLGTSALVYYLAFKFLGTGIHALQVSGIVSANPRAYLPDLGLVGAFPTVETTLAQGILLLAGLVWLASRRRFDTVTGDPRTMDTDPSARRRWQP
jgi:high-affinity iron transporter